MAYDERLAERIRSALTGVEPVTERKMFGGLAFMLAGNMVCGVIGDDMLARVGPERFEEALASPGARPMDFTGRPMKGMVFVRPDGCERDEQLARWLEQTLAYARSLPAK